MLKILKYANLPSSSVRLCAVGSGNNQAINELKRLGVTSVQPKPSPKLLESESTHADMLMLHLGKEQIILSKEQKELATALTDFGFTPKLLETKFSSKYPENILLNAAIIKEKFFAHKNSINIFKKHKEFEFYPINQGYAKCSTCILNSSAAITEDESVFTSLKQAGLDVLKIKKGEVKLKGMNYGFFGGATGKLSPSILAINGELRYNSDEDIITSFLRNHGIYVVELKSGQIEDIGGILPLLEEE